MVHVVEIFEHLDLFKLDQHLKFHLVDLVFTFDKLLVLSLDPVHLQGQLQIEIFVVFLLKNQILLKKLNLLAILFNCRENTGIKCI